MTDPLEGLESSVGFTLLSAFRRPIDAEVAAAKDAELRRFVRALRDEFAHLWPEVKTAGTRTTVPRWPACWEQHPGFTTELLALQRWHDDIAWGQTKGDINLATHDWLTFLRTEIVRTVADISGRVCRDGHTDATRPAHRPRLETPSQPPLPGQMPVPAPVVAPVASQWDGFGRRSQDVGGDSGQIVGPGIG